MRVRSLPVRSPCCVHRCELYIGSLTTCFLNTKADGGEPRFHSSWFLDAVHDQIFTATSFIAVLLCGFHVGILTACMVNPYTLLLCVYMCEISLYIVFAVIISSSGLLSIWPNAWAKSDKYSHLISSVITTLYWLNLRDRDIEIVKGL